MPWIQNVAAVDIARGDHKHDLGHTVLIRIFDPASAYRPDPEKQFNAVYEFEFLDIEDSEHEFAITQEQADHLAGILRDSLAKEMNVVVHCYAGVCRSGAVCEVGVMIGYDDLKGYRQPNVLVKSRLMKSLGLNIDESTSAFNVTE